LALCRCSISDKKLSVDCQFYFSLVASNSDRCILVSWIDFLFLLATAERLSILPSCLLRASAYVLLISLSSAKNPWYSRSVACLLASNIAAAPRDASELLAAILLPSRRVLAACLFLNYISLNAPVTGEYNS